MPTMLTLVFLYYSNSRVKIPTMLTLVICMQQHLSRLIAAVFGTIIIIGAVLFCQYTKDYLDTQLLDLQLTSV